MPMDYAYNAKVLKNIRVWTNANLPLYGTYIGYDLAIQILESCDKTHRLSLKEIYHSLPHSEPQLRRKLRAFEKDGWVRLLKNIHDQRNCHVEPSEKMLDAYDKYFHLIASQGRDIKFY